MKIEKLEEKRIEFSRRRLIATPIAGLIAWTTVGISSFFLSSFGVSMVLFIATGLIVYLGIFISKFTGENFLIKDRQKNSYDGLFLYSVGMSILVYVIAIPFFLIDYTSLPLTVGILTGLMWLPISWLVRHWIGFIHGIARTIGVLTAWYAFPDHRFLAVSTVIVLLFLIVIPIQELRWRKINVEIKEN